MLNNWKFWVYGAFVMDIIALIFAITGLGAEDIDAHVVGCVSFLCLCRMWFRHGKQMKADETKKGK